ncbi:ABC transporter substrate-binding protein [Clostridia bacterium]|nr:ABC transporter substrate-binding protein [Clostridia bacterium]
MKKKVWSLLLIAALAVGLLLTGCAKDNGSGGNAPAGSSGGDAAVAAGEGEEVELLVIVGGEPRSLDPAYNYETASFHVVNSISDSLLAFDEAGALKPSIADRWEAVDPTTYVYHIREGAKFSDGSDLTIEDVIYSLERIRDPELAADTQWMYASVASIEQTGDREVTVKLSQPDANWQYVPATSGGQIVSKAYVEEKGDSFGKNDGGTLGTGPYKLESWTAGSQIALTRNEFYWGDKPDIDRVVVNFASDANAVQLALETGQAEFAITNAKTTLESFENSDTINVINKPSIGNSVVSFNTQKAPFDDVNVRRAIASAIDSAGITQSQLGSYGSVPGDLPFGEAGYTLGSRDSWVSFNAGLPDYSYDLDKAKEYLAQSAYPDGFATTIYFKPNDIPRAAAQVIQAALKELNIDLTLNEVQLSDYYAYAYGGQITDGIRDYDIGINDWQPDFPDPIGHLTPQYWSQNAGPGGSNYAAYSNPEVDALIEAQNNTTDPNERAKLIQEAFALAADDAPYKYLYYMNNSLLLNKKYEYELSPMWIFGLNYKDVKVVG